MIVCRSISPCVVGTLSPYDSDDVGSDGMLSSSDLCWDTVPSRPCWPCWPCWPVWDAVPSDSDAVAPVDPDGTLSSSDLAGILPE